MIQTTLDSETQAHPSAHPSDALELSIVMPCLNEALTLPTCIRKAQRFLTDHKLCGEIVVADNGSVDRSPEIARELGARVVHARTRGYGAALAVGISAARGRYVIMGDADDSYDFQALMPFLRELRAGADLVMGDRFKGGIEPGAMPLLHRYLGNPILSFLGRLFFHLPCGDFHCGLRGFSRRAILDLGLTTTGMEFASEMLVRAGLARLKIKDVPTRLAKDGRARRSHLRTWRDGWRHLRFLLLFSPRWLFFYPGLAMIALGVATALILLPGPVEIAPGVNLDVHTLLFACVSVLVGVQSITFGMLARRYAAARGFLPASEYYGRFLEKLTLERLLQIGLLLVICGIGGLLWAFSIWRGRDFGPLNYTDVMRIMLVAVTFIASGVQICLAGFLASVMEIENKP
jgi:glycosyltransferase involved in cell wall biosynthesis